MWFANTTSNPIVAFGDTFEINGVATVANTTIQVSDSADAGQQSSGSDNPTDTNGLISLRSAIAAANFDANLGASDTITFAPKLNGSTLRLTQGDLELTAATGTTTIDGGGQITVSGNNASGVFEVDSGAEGVLTGLTITGGNAGAGGGIYNSGTLTVSSSTLSANSAYAGFDNDEDFPGISGCGGGIYNSGTLTVSNSTLSGNFADSTQGF